METAWFAIRCQTEREETIAKSLEARVKKNGVEDEILRLIVPTEYVSEIRKGERRVVKSKMFPGYIFAEIALNEDGRVSRDSWFTVMDTPGVSGFVSQDRMNPEPMEREEVDRILENMREREEKPRPKIMFKVGEKVRIREGSFENYEAEIEEVLHDKGRLKLKVSIFGRYTPLELEFSKVELV